MTVTSTLKDVSFEAGSVLVREGAAFVDLRPVPAYLDVHIPGSLCLPYEFGPGLAGRARDCLPLDLALLLLDDADAGADVVHAAASLRGKGFDVLGRVRDGLRQWGQTHGPPRSTEIVTRVPEGSTALDVGDPGSAVPEGSTRIPIEQLWIRTGELSGPVAIAAGFGVRSALAVGILEHAGFEDLFFFQTR